MIAVLTVFASHLWGLPPGGFIGVDVFFVISGFLITGNLLRSAETGPNVSFKTFYWNRVRRIVPAATVVLIVTYLASTIVFLPFRSEQIGVDALWAFVFLSNWRFAIEGTDYFTANNAVSPIQHYWSLSIEEQFYFVWPAVIFLIGVLVIRKTWTHEHRMRAAGVVMACIITASLGWAIYQTAVSPLWAYFDTFARIWELGVGALLATMTGRLARIRESVRPWLSWAGLALIAASIFLIGEGSAGFPAPWAILPVIGAALVVAAGVGIEPKYQAFLRNPVSGYIGDISYSLYLVHWPVIIIVGTLMDPGVAYSVAVIALAFGLAVASYHFVENPLRRADGARLRKVVKDIRRRRHQPLRSSKYAALGALALLAVGLIAFSVRPESYVSNTPPAVVAVAPEELDPSEPPLGPLTSALQVDIVAALKADDWPVLDPSMESVIDDPVVKDPNVPGCGGPVLLQQCSWGSPDAPIRVLIAGNSVAVYYVQPLREIAESSGGRIQVHTEAMPGCNFINEMIFNSDQMYVDACPGRKQQFIDLVNTTKPDVVILSHNYSEKRVNGTDRDLTPSQWAGSMRDFVEQFRDSAKEVVLLAPPPGDDVLISECYSKRGSTPADCIGHVTSEWRDMAEAEQDLAGMIGAVWVDSRPWFCSSARLCPSFVGSTPTKLDRAHVVPAYGLKIAPVIRESFEAAGIF